MTQHTLLPYVFDLLYDIKTLEALHGHLLGTRRQATSATDQQLVDLMQEHNVPLPAGYTARRATGVAERVIHVHAFREVGPTDLVAVARVGTDQLLSDGALHEKAAAALLSQALKGYGKREQADSYFLTYHDSFGTPVMTEDWAEWCSPGAVARGRVYLENGKPMFRYPPAKCEPVPVIDLRGSAPAGA